MEIHKPHAAKTWKEFFIELGTIVIGILIAIGLEQSVDYVHHLDQLRDLRVELRAELDENLRQTTENVKTLDGMEAKLDRDMAVLHASQTSHAAPAAKLDYSWDGFGRPFDGAWQAAGQSGALALMPHRELQKYTFAYNVMHDFMATLSPAVVQLKSASAIAHRAPEGALTPHDVEELVTATSEARAKIGFSDRLNHFEQLAILNTR